MDFLKTLRIESTNNGVSTGTQWINSKGETIDSFSPVDGKKIGSVTAADKISYEAVVKKAEEAFTKASIAFVSLTNYGVLIKMAVEKGIVSTEQQNGLLNWRNNPSEWQG